jgi:hypothetical protein
MKWHQLLDRLDLEDDFASNDKVQSMFAEQMAAVGEGVRLLAFERDGSRCELETDSAAVGVFEQTGSELAVDGDAATDGLVNQPLNGVRKRARNLHEILLSFVLFVSLRVFVVPFNAPTSAGP